MKTQVKGACLIAGFALTAGATLMSLSAPAIADPPADPGQNVGNPTGGGFTDGEALAPDVAAAGAVKAADFARAYANYRQNVAQAAAQGKAGQGTVNNPNGHQGTVVQPYSCPVGQNCNSAVLLSVQHAGQNTNYYCGPASGFMILRYEGEGPSNYNGATLTQGHVAGPAHMETDQYQETDWYTDLWDRGVNRWRNGTNTGAYAYSSVPSPSNDAFRGALVSDLGSFMPFGVSTVEYADSAHYNGHPKSELIGHWIVAQGYTNYTDNVSFDDPATSVWSTASADFTAYTDHFNQTFIDPHGFVG